MSTPKELMLTGHANGVISVWSSDRNGKYSAEEEFQVRVSLVDEQEVKLKELSENVPFVS